MKRSLAEVNYRRNHILEYLEQQKISDIKQIATTFDISEMTARRDCDALKKMGRIKKHFGKIEFIYDIDSMTKDIDALEEIKETLAMKAATFVKKEDTIFINSSSTALMVLNYLKDKPINLLTNNTKIVQIEYHPHSTIFLSGGEVRSQKEALTGSTAVQSFHDVRSDVTIISCSGISLENGITTSVMNEAKVNEQIITNSGRLIVVADYRKIGYTSNFTIGNIADIDILITDQYAEKKVLDDIEAIGTQVIQVFI